LGVDRVGSTATPFAGDAAARGALQKKSCNAVANWVFDFL
jgi:hypothetical protein